MPSQQYRKCSPAKLRKLQAGLQGKAGRFATDATMTGRELRTVQRELAAVSAELSRRGKGARV